MFKKKKSVKLENTNGSPTEKQQPQARTLTQHHRQMACWITPALAHWSLSLPLPQCISGSIWAIHLIRNSISFGHFFKFMVFTSVFVVMLPFHLLDLSVFLFIVIMSTTLQLSLVWDHKPLQFTKQINSPATVFSCSNTKMDMYFSPPFLALCDSF